MSNWDDDFEQQIQELREDHYARQMERCCECGSDDVCATVGHEAYCGECWRERQARKAAKKASQP